MSRLDYSIPSFSLLIGSFNATDYLDTINLTQGISELSSYLTWTGEFELSYNRKAQVAGLTAADFDQFATPGRWRPDQQEIVLTIAGHAFPTMRIRKYSYNAQAGIGRGELYQVLDLFSGDRPGEDLELFAGARGSNLSNVAQRLLELAFEGASITPDIDLLEITGYLDSPMTSRDPIADAQKLVATQYHWLWVDNDEAVRSVSGDPKKNEVLFRRSLSQVEWDPDLEGIDFAAEKVTITGSRQVAVVSADDAPPADEEQEQTHDEEGKPVRLELPTYKKRYSLYPTLYSADPTSENYDTTDVLAEIKTIKYFYWGQTNTFELIPIASPAPGQPPPVLPPQVGDFADQYEVGQLVQTVVTVQKTRGEVLPNTYEGDTVLIEAEKTIETDFAKVVLKPKAVLNPETEDTTLDVATSEILDKGRVNPDGSIPNQTDPRTGKALTLEASPRKEYRFKSPDWQFEEQTLKSEVELEPNGWTPVIPKPYTEDVGFIPDQAHLDYLAQQIALREIRRRDAINITMPIPLEWLAAGCPPLRRCRIHNAELQIDNPILNLDGSGQKCTFAFTGGRLGTIPAVPNPPPPPPYVPVAGIAIAPPPAVLTVVDTTITAYTFTAIGGTGPYTWTMVDALPTGLSLSSSGVLSGTPTTAIAGAYHTVQVTDSAAATATIELWVEVISDTAPIEPVSIKVNLDYDLVFELEIKPVQQIGVSPEIAVELEIVEASLLVEPEVAIELEITVTEGGGGGS